MPRIAYIEKNLSPDRLATIEKVNAIIAEYEAQGFALTLRQLYYQFVARDLIRNNLQEYKRLGDLVNDGRLVGLIDWEAIVDRTRNLQSVARWNDPPHILEAVAEQFRIDKWATQPYRVEVWIEKDALVGVIERVCKDLDVPYFSCRGYTSQSEMWAGAMRLNHYRRGTRPGALGRVNRSQTPIILHFGDHDPSGKDMTRDIEDRLRLFMGGTEVRRLALNFDQIEAFRPPPNPAKLSDSRAAAYVAEFGDDSWELDALEPSVIVGLIQDMVLELRDPGLWNDAEAEEHEHRSALEKVYQRWEAVTKFLERRK